MKTLRLFTFAALVITFTSSAMASEKVFFGRWQPPTSLKSFWDPIQESWWNSERLAKYCKSFAKQSSSKALIGDIVLDLKRNPSVERTFVYTLLILNWNHQEALRLLQPFYKSDDPEIRKIVDDFVADIEEQQSEEGSGPEPALSPKAAIAPEDKS